MILVINSGSSSIKYQLIDPNSEKVFAKGLVERIGTDGGVIEHKNLENNTENTVQQEFKDHTEAFTTLTEVFAKYGPSLDNVNAVGHRVVQGGEELTKPTIITDKVIEKIKQYSELAPLHNPPALAGIKAAQQLFSNIKHVAIFDTAFHSTMPKSSYTYAIPTDLAKKYGIRRYGFHGTSHAYVSKKVAEVLGQPYSQINSIILHIGNGASASAVKNGKSLHTTMGLTPLEGLVMGSRSGDIDPAIVSFLIKKGYDVNAVENILNKESGVLGLTGFSDMRDVNKAITDGNDDAKVAMEIYTNKIKQTIGSYCALLGKVDAIAFTAGVGENDAVVRQMSTAGLQDIFGIIVDEKINATIHGTTAKISADNSKIPVYVIPTNEELEIAKQTAAVI